MVIDIIFDAWLGISSKKDQHYCFGRAFVAAIILPAAIYLQYQFLRDITDYDLARDFVIIFTCIRIAFVNSMLFCLCITDRLVFTVRRTSSVGFVITLNAVFRVFATASNEPILNKMSMITAALTIILAICLCGMWIYSLKSSRQLNDISSGFFMIPFTIGCFGCLVLLFLIDKNWSTRFNDATPLFVTGIVYRYCALVIIISIIPGRISRIQVVASKVR
jgi:preprotein translocase subunit SecG